MLALAAALRLYRLMDDYPIVSDESIYLRWAEIIDHQGQWFISLLDGKQPLSIWLYALQRMIWPNLDPLLPARLASVVAGVGSVYLLYLIGRRLAGELTGTIAALLFAVFPWAMMYDRLAYTEGLLNVAGLALMWTTLWAFAADKAAWHRMALAGLALGVAYFVKSPAALFGIIPIAVGLWQKGLDVGLLKRWAVIFLVAAVFPAFSAVMKPDAPTFETQDLLLHHTTFFASPAELVENPFYRLVENTPRFGEYLPYLAGIPASLAALAALLYLGWRRSAPGIVVGVIAVGPLVFELFILTFLPTRYPYPFLWPWLLLIALAAGRLKREFEPRLGLRRSQAAAAALVAVLAVAPMLWRSWRILNDPKNEISPHDSSYLFGDYAHAGFGVREAVETLTQIARRTGPFVLLVDPIWNVPADAIFPYLNQKHGIRVHEAWWTQQSATHPIMPNARVRLMRSHYERVRADWIDFQREPRVLYLTDTNYNPQPAVLARQPTAKLLMRIEKPGKTQSIDIYQLK